MVGWVSAYEGVHVRQVLLYCVTVVLLHSFQILLENMILHSILQVTQSNNYQTATLHQGCHALINPFPAAV